PTSTPATQPTPRPPGVGSRTSPPAVATSSTSSCTPPASARWARSPTRSLRSAASTGATSEPWEEHRVGEGMSTVAPQSRATDTLTSVEVATPSAEQSHQLGRARGTDFFAIDDLLTDEERAVRDKVRAFADEKVIPVANEYWERADFVPR